MKIFRVIFMSKLAFHTGQRSLIQVISRLSDHPIWGQSIFLGPLCQTDFSKTFFRIKNLSGINCFESKLLTEALTNDSY